MAGTVFLSNFELARMSHQIFGITLNSTAANESETVQLIRFAVAVAKSGASGSVKSVTYDSDQKIARFEFNASIQCEAQQACVFAAAGKTLSRFVWLDGETYLGDLE